MNFSIQARDEADVDVLVAGGGPAGCEAAIAACRRGLSVLLVEATSALGGIAANLLAGRAIHAAGYVPVFCVLGFCHLTAFAVLFATGKKGVSHE